MLAPEAPYSPTVVSSSGADGRRRGRVRPSALLVALELAAGVALLGAAAVAGVAFVHRPWENRLDVWGFAAFPAEPHSRRWHLVADAGSLKVLLVGVAVAAALSVWRDRARALACLVGPPLAVIVTERIAKPLVGRHVTPFGGFSYPSGTTTAVTALVVAAVLALPWLIRPVAAVIGLALVGAVGCAVVALRWHFPTDALGGALVGAGSVLLVDGLFHAAARMMSRTGGRPGDGPTVAGDAQAAGGSRAQLAELSSASEGTGLSSEPYSASYWRSCSTRSPVRRSSPGRERSVRAR